MLFLPGFIIPEAPEDLISFSFIVLVLRNIKANSNGSVTPVKNAEIDPASNNPYTTFFLILLFTMIHC